ncbi:MAG: hypothetical protein IJI46_05710 [Erysipelotrichaceae bacterium]|nr:hypothetical protein [Erysipelotrichaceae bacterium]
MLYDYLLETYGKSNPIFVSDIRYKNSSTNYIRQQIKKLADEGKIRRYDSGIYYIPSDSMFPSGSMLSREKVIEEKYLRDDKGQCGYYSGFLFANQLGITSQVPAGYEIVTNKTGSEYREITLGNLKIILKKPKTSINDGNYKILQLLDLLKNLDYYGEIKDEEIRRKINDYMIASEIEFEDMNAYLPLYPDKIYRNMYEKGIIKGALERE